MKSVAGFNKSEFIEKKSRFIGLLYHVETLEEINAYLEKAKIDYPNANHYTYAYILDDILLNTRMMASRTVPLDIQF